MSRRPPTRAAYERAPHRPLRTDHGGRHSSGPEKAGEIATFRADGAPPARESQLCISGGPPAGGRISPQPFVHGRRDCVSARARSSSNKLSAEFFEYLRGFRFTGDLFAVPEGTPLFAGEPLLTVRAPIIEAQIPETYLLAAMTFPTRSRAKPRALRSNARRPKAGASSNSVRAARTRPKPEPSARAPPMSGAARAPATQPPE